MNKSELTNDVGNLITTGKTKEAFQLLSKAQLSKNDKNLILLLGQFSKLQEDVLTNQLSPEEEHRIRARLHKSMLQFLEKLDPEEINRKPKKQIDNVNTDPKPNFLQPEEKENIFKKYKAYFLLLLIIPLIAFVLWNRTASPPVKAVPNSLTSQGDIAPAEKVSDAFLKNPKNIWNTANSLYFEDFSNYKEAGFRNDIWSLETKARDFEMKVEDAGHYKINIKTDKSDNSFSRHKYIGKINYDVSTEIIPFTAKIKIDKTANCKGGAFCMGRGITTRYDDSKKSAYAFTINDQGDLYFKRLNDFRKPKNSKNLFTKNIPIKKGGIYELGIVSQGADFYLYLNKEFLKKVTDQQVLKGTLNGVIAVGKGNHLFDEVALYKMN